MKDLSPVSETDDIDLSAIRSLAYVAVSQGRTVKFDDGIVAFPDILFVELFANYPDAHPITDTLTITIEHGPHEGRSARIYRKVIPPHG